MRGNTRANNFVVVLTPVTRGTIGAADPSIRANRIGRAPMRRPLQRRRRGSAWDRVRRLDEGDLRIDRSEPLSCRMNLT